jgi:hypothetical protein
VPSSPDQLPDEPEALKRIITAMAQDAINGQAEIAKLRFQLARYRRAEFGRSSEKLEREADQLELAIEALETDQAERLAAVSPIVAAIIESAKKTGSATLVGAPAADETVRKLSRKSELAAAFRYMRARWAALVRCFDNGRLALDNNPAERALRGVAIGRKNWLFAGSNAGGRRAAAMYSLIESAKLNGINPQHYLADVLTRIADHPARRISELLPWSWKPAIADRVAA